jgi:hypothetical protein
MGVLMFQDQQIFVLCQLSCVIEEFVAVVAPSKKFRHRTIKTIEKTIAVDRSSQTK